MLHIALYQPEIPPNTGNIIRLCANSGAQLHLVHPLGFTLDDKKMRRAGLDYHEWAKVIHYENEEHFLDANANRRIFACSTKGQKNYSDVVYQDNDLLLFGPETRGLPPPLRERFEAIRIPMCPHSRSLNLSNSVAIILFEAWRQLGFPGSTEHP
ncbi:tRNA (uridine(34)/cytosine(34)/5-carboxymethylaminomethyluridine(34)-2'-O)-methyltransferase TrmL [Legionella jordanis]|uniref:tRNA (cytidine(34)-2'-O)-methyltransferase n=1 Tax=Legionella jordanis TaxID=456 RepID=A0A0W0V9Z9_9GAMM|nr:tRNA (uridine(34)/cytosine(34)/5-carboxymethylaminomethyluridine(34)-2'-O)-methyltransferase TrmL [Legionella jordanis]KTD16694.1 RNA methyltransferase TrmH family, group 2 [Legionella jordanis]RMX03774.1 tRNA (uridine(34)/cytosine(34)/5-carboxymethylaminomethyluridine(34)-2'-O)-methyltransferase TrmL [Legionella jordanis]RMX22165.1 tRNA (uridine(34)/cytosine(34)/5-carboxymethylaminomethyluridine(34)-2'-O)-methyltransferase TrmL [Legionella jordanis]VEH11838.1 RNA methyltransferase TrmH fami